jgi:hypothetical protein
MEVPAVAWEPGSVKPQPAYPWAACFKASWSVTKI